MLPIRTLLASASPRRRELLRLLNTPFDVCSTDVDETPLPDETAEEMVVRLARLKADVARAANPDALVIAADTTVELNGRTLGKPQDAEDARRMLRELRGREHHVHGGIALCGPGLLETIQVCTRVWMRAYSDLQVEAYVASGDPLDKAAAYAVQHQLFRPVERMEGCYANVMGLALCRLAGALSAHYAMPMPSIACPLHPERDCSVTRLVDEGLVAGS